jgi:hypothetical protein
MHPCIHAPGHPMEYWGGVLVKHGQINACGGELFNPLQKIYNSRSDKTNPIHLIPALFIRFEFCYMNRFVDRFYFGLFI